MQHARKWNCFADVLEATDPGDGSFDAHAEAGVGDASVLAQIEIPLEGFFGKIVLVDALDQEFVGRHALRSADNFSVAFRSKDVDAKSEFGTDGVGLHVEGFYDGWITMDHDGTIVER